MVTAAQYTALKTDASKVTADQTALAADQATDTTDTTSFASGLTGPVIFLNSDGTADVITPTPGTAPGFAVTTATVLT